MMKMIPSGLKIDVRWEEEKFLERQVQETELYIGELEVLQHNFNLEGALCCCYIK